MTLTTPITVVRGSLPGYPKTVSRHIDIIDQVRYIEDGVLIAKQGQIRWFGSLG